MSQLQTHRRYLRVKCVRKRKKSVKEDAQNYFKTNSITFSCQMVVVFQLLWLSNKHEHFLRRILKIERLSVLGSTWCRSTGNFFRSTYDRLPREPPNDWKLSSGALSSVAPGSWRKGDWNGVGRASDVGRG